MTEKTDNELVRACLKGSTAAFEALIDRYQKAIFNTALRLVNDRDEAKDITQEVFIRAYEKLNTFNPEFKFFSWIYKMTLNQSINVINRRKAHTILNSDIVAPEKGPEAKFEARQTEKMVQAAIDSMSIDHRIILVLRHFADLSYRELGFVLEIPEKTVKSRLFSARQRLGEILMKQGITEYDI